MVSQERWPKTKETAASSISLHDRYSALWIDPDEPPFILERVRGEIGAGR